MMDKKFIIYQLLPRIFGNTNENCIPDGSLQINGTGKFSSINETVFEHLHTLGVTHVWYTGVIEHATKESFEQWGIRRDNPSVIKGQAGSPYAIKDYYDVNPYLADSVENRMAEFEELVQRTHNAGFKVVLDFVPNHLAREYNSDSLPYWAKDFGIGDNENVFSPDNNYYYLPGEMFSMGTYHERPAKATGNDCFTAYPSVNDWYETVKLNYGIDYMNGRKGHFYPIPKTWYMMNDILCFWASKGVDAFRCDMAELVPVEFWEWCIKEVKHKYPKIQFIAEVYNPAEYSSYMYRGGFDYLYDKVGLYDTLKYISQGYKSSSEITGCWQSIDDKQNHMLNFLENHDEQRFCSEFFGKSTKAAMAPLYTSLFMNTAPFMIYFGEEAGECGMDEEGFSGRDGRTTIFDWWSVGSIRRLRKLISSGEYKSLNPGKITKAGLKKEEAEHFCRFAMATRFAASDEAIRKGSTYDLCYCNYGSEGFDKDRHYVFLRDHHDHTLLIACNFSNHDTKMKITIPQHAFEWMEIPVTDSFHPGSTIEVSVPSMDGVIIQVV